MKRSACILGLWLASVAVALPHGLPAQAQSAALVGPRAQPPEAFEVQLLRVAELLATLPACGVEPAAEELSRQGAECVPAIVSTLAEGKRRAGQSGRQALNEPESRLLIAALRRLPQASREFAAQVARTQTPASERRVAMLVVGEIGASGELRLLLELARPRAAQAESGSQAGVSERESTDAEPDFDDADQLRASISRILVRDPRALAALEALFDGAGPALRPILVAAIADNASSESLELLARQLGDHEGLDLCLLSSISRCASRQAAPFEAAITDAVRRMLDTETPELLREAAQACGRLEDIEAIPRLVALLSHANRPVGLNAHWALRRISGMGLAADPKAWTPWFQAEQRWWAEAAQELLAELETAERARALAIVQELARHRYPRHQLARELAVGLSHADPSVRRLTCVALSELGSRTAVDALRARQDDPAKGVRAQVRQTLEVLVGSENGPNGPAGSHSGR